MAEEIFVAVGDAKTTARRFRAKGKRRARFIFAHGAGAGQRHPFMVRVAEGLAARGIEVVTFDFLYMEQKRRVPDRAPALEACWRAVLERFTVEKLFIGGKSMGGRIASMVAAGGMPGVDGLLFLGYPLHPPDKPEQRRDAHLPQIAPRMLFVQGERDPFGTRAEMEPLVEKLPRARLYLVPGGDHSLKVAKRLQLASDAAVQEVMIEFMIGSAKEA